MIYRCKITQYEREMKANKTASANPSRSLKLRCQDNTFSPTIETISVNVNSILQKVTGSWKMKIPTNTVPTAPIPVQTG